jgi:hypothetical protein
MSEIDKINDLDSQPVSQIIYNMIKWFNVDSVTQETEYRSNVESTVWMTLKITMKDKTWYIEGQRLDIIKDRLIGWFKRNIKPLTNE